MEQRTFNNLLKEAMFYVETGKKTNRHPSMFNYWYVNLSEEDRKTFDDGMSNWLVKITDVFGNLVSRLENLGETIIKGMGEGLK